MAGVRVTQPTAGTGQGSASTTPEIDTADIDYSAGAGTDVRERQRFLLSGTTVNSDVDVATAEPASGAAGLIVRPVGMGTDGASPPTIPGTGVRGWLRSIYDRLTDGSQRTSIATPGGAAYVTTAGIATPLVPTTSGYGRLRVTEEAESLFYDPFDVVLNTTDMWNPTVTTSGATITQGTGGETFSSGTTAGAIARLQSIPTFVGQVPGFMEIGYALQFLASPPTNVARFWGVGTPPIGGATATAPVFDGIGWLVDIDAKLYAMVYSAGTEVFRKDLSAIMPTDGFYKRYNIQARTDRIFWYFGSQDVPVADASFKFPQTQKLPLLVQLVNHTTAPATSSQIVCTGVAVGDTGRSATQIADGLYGFRKATVRADSPTPTDMGLVTRVVSSPPNAIATGTLGAAATSSAAQVLAPTANATAVQLTVPDGHSSWEIYLYGTFSAASQVFFEGSSDGTDQSWFAVNGRRNTDSTTNEQSSILDNAPKGGASPAGAGLSNWRGAIGGIKYLRVRCGTFTAGDAINVRTTTSVATGAVFQNSNPPLPSDFYSTGSLAAVADTVSVQAGGSSSWSSLMVGNFTGTVFFEASVDGTTYNKINGAIQGVGSLQTQLSGTGTANQTLQVRGSSGGLKNVRLRAGADFVGTFTGTIRAGGGSGGVFMTAPVPIAGLSNAVVTNRVTLATTGATATRIDSSLTTRTSVEVKYIANTATNNAYVYVGLTTGTTAANGRELSPGESWTLDITSFQALYAVGSVANQQVQVTELG